MTDYTLHYAPDNASLIIRLALEAQGVAYDTCLVDRAAQGQSAPAYRALNPHGLIPALQTPDGPLFETGAILLWLADRHGGWPLPRRMPRGRISSSGCFSLPIRCTLPCVCCFILINTWALTTPPKTRCTQP
ncbi:hypothetical protein Sulfitobl28_14720 [Sulfitobacter pontiacus]|nr:hypothetical protein Sulfitobl28_14720 [Sulfitobacter pontiacus]